MARLYGDRFGSGGSRDAAYGAVPPPKGLAEDPKVNLIVRSIVSLAHALQIRVNAEGVETDGQLRALQKHACDELQGFLLGRPKPSTMLVHDNAAAEPPQPPQMPETGFAGLPTMPAPL
ncbi:MAG TPA: EAL domain-containing protein [Burkholderiaceae bacterium]|nr:EAL domain-containing protein [Burkholderiaceae bacterium]